MQEWQMETSTALSSSYYRHLHLSIWQKLCEMTVLNGTETKIVEH